MLYLHRYRYFDIVRSAIPDWARGKALAKILDKQYGGPNPLNPDKIFPEFFTCNLEHIFNTKKQKWDRSSRWVAFFPPSLPPCSSVNCRLQQLQDTHYGKLKKRTDARSSSQINKKF